jgi:BirA family biotin operon repressor/biotin-[acetyl-CoA-carboxylase] ligase
MNARRASDATVDRGVQAVGADLRKLDILSGLTTKRIGDPLYLLQEVDSTSGEAALLAVHGASEGTVVIARAQRRGRGRMGRQWSSPPGLGVYLSVILRPPILAQQVPALALLGAAAAAEAIERVTGLATRIKWPNDLIVRDRKAGGVLGEAAVEGASLQHVILGIGLNVNQTEADFEENLRTIATSLRIESGRVIDRIVTIRSLCESLDAWYDRFLSDGIGPILERIRQRCLTLGRRIVGRSGHEEVRGLAVGIDDVGALVVRDLEGRTRRLVAGDVTLTG